MIKIYRNLPEMSTPWSSTKAKMLTSIEEYLIRHIFLPFSPKNLLKIELIQNLYIINYLKTIQIIVFYIKVLKKHNYFYL